MPLKILVAEDNAKISEAYKKILSLRGHEVAIANDGLHALKLYKSELSHGNTKNNLPYDVLLVDFSMPKMDGATLVGEILDLRPQQRILFATAHEKDLIKKFDKIGRPVEVLNKPFKLSSLIKNIESKVSLKQRNIPTRNSLRKWDGSSNLSFAGPGPSRSGSAIH